MTGMQDVKLIPCEPHPDSGVSGVRGVRLLKLEGEDEEAGDGQLLAGVCGMDAGERVEDADMRRRISTKLCDAWIVSSTRLLPPLLQLLALSRSLGSLDMRCRRSCRSVRAPMTSASCWASCSAVWLEGAARFVCGAANVTGEKRSKEAAGVLLLLVSESSQSGLLGGVGRRVSSLNMKSPLLTGSKSVKRVMSISSALVRGIDAPSQSMCPTAGTVGAKLRGSVWNETPSEKSMSVLAVKKDMDSLARQASLSTSKKAGESMSVTAGSFLIGILVNEEVSA